MKLVIGNKALHFCETFVPSNGRKNVYVFLTQKINPKNHIFFFFQIVEIHFYFIESNFFLIKYENENKNKKEEEKTKNDTRDKSRG